MEYFGLLFEVLFFALGTYLYLFSRGRFNSSDPAAQKKVEEFRKKNGNWLRILGLLVMAIMAINIIVHIQQLLGTN